LVVFQGVWRSDAVLKALVDWPPFQKRYPKSHWIADDLAVTVSEFSSQTIQKLTVKSLIDCIDDGRCDSTTAICLNQITQKLQEEQTWNVKQRAKLSRFLG
jgi:hypothetical protein